MRIASHCRWTARFATVLLCLAGGRPANAQAPNFVEGLSRTRPILRPASEAPTATIRQIRFNGNRQSPVLYSGGDDKVVRRWSLAEVGGTLQLKTAPALDWPIYRAVRGLIYTVDVRTTASGDRAAFGGLGAKPSWAKLLHVDRPDGAELLIDNHGQPNQRVLGRDNLVNCVALGPNALQLAVAHERSGIVLLWTLDDRKSVGACRALPTNLANVWVLAYDSSGERLALAGPSAAGAWEVQVWTTGAAAGFVERQAVSAPVSALIWSNANKWIAATTIGVAHQGESAMKLASTDVRGLAATSNGNLRVIAVYSENTNHTQLKSWDGREQTRDLPFGAFVGKDVSLDVSGDGRYIAGAGTVPDSKGLPLYAVRFWDGATQQYRTQFPDETIRKTQGAPVSNVGVVPGVAVAGGGVTPWQVGFAWGSHSKTSLPAYQFQFNPVTRQITPRTDQLGAREQTRFSGNFKVKVSGRDETRVFLVNNDSAKRFIDPWGALPDWGGRTPVCFATNARETLLAVGYNDGIVLCDLTKLHVKNINLLTEAEMNSDRAVLRSFYGHEGPTTCLSFDPEDKLLFSGSKDGTICAWKIDDLTDPKLPRVSELGVELERQVDGNKFYVKIKRDPAPGSIGAEAGFRGGQQIFKVFVAGRELPPAEWERTLGAPVPGKELLVHVRQPGQQNVTALMPTPVSRDPLWTFYPQFDLNWSAWTPEGHFDVSNTDVIDRLAWHVNLNNEEAAERPIGFAPSMQFGGREFQDLFHKPQIVDQALLQRKPDLPRDAVLPPSLRIVTAQNAATLTALPNGREPITELELWLNGLRLGKKDRKQLAAAGDRALSVALRPELLRARGNQLTGVAVIEVIDPATKKPALVYSRTITPLPDPAPRAVQRKLHYVGAGVTTLAKGFAGAAPLQFAHHDAVELGDVLRRTAKGAFEAGSFEVLADYEGCKPPTEANIQAALDRLAQTAAADDFAIVLLSGHGLIQDGFKFIAQDTPSAAAGKITDQLINDKLAQLPCRTLLLLDACHAGGAQVRQDLQDWPGFGVGPIILAASDSEHESYEHELVGLKGGLRGHGLFTAALLECLVGEPAGKMSRPPIDLNSDRQLSVAELCEYAKGRTTSLSDLAGPYVPDRGRQYTPKVLRSLTFSDHREFVFAPAPPKTEPAAGR